MTLLAESVTAADVLRAVREVADTLAEFRAEFERYRPLLDRIDPGANMIAQWKQLRGKARKPCKCQEHDG